MEENKSGSLLQALLLGGGGGSGGATSLNDLSDVEIKQPVEYLQILSANAQGKFYNASPELSSFGVPEIGPKVNDEWGGWKVFRGMNDSGETHYEWATFSDLATCKILTISGQIVTNINLLLSNLKTAAKANGKAGISFPNDAIQFLQNLSVELDNKHPGFIIQMYDENTGSEFYTFNGYAALGVYSRASFSSSHSDSDGIYHITVVFEMETARISVEYTACPAMS